MLFFSDGKVKCKATKRYLHCLWVVLVANFCSTESTEADTCLLCSDFNTFIIFGRLFRFFMIETVVQSYNR